MEQEILILSPLVAFLVTLLVLPLWIKKMKELGFLWDDMNKYNHSKKVASSGGIVVVMGFVIGIFLYIGIKTFILGSADEKIINILALTTVILILALIGIIDDLFGWQKGGLSKRSRLFLALFASIPLVALNVGVSSFDVPFIGIINIGILYPVLVIPFVIAGCSTVYNFLAGFNGLEASQGIIILSALSFVAYQTDSAYLALAGIVMIAALIGFYFFNRNPASVFPGDSITLSIGALIAGMAIVGNFEKIATFIFIPYLLEMILKLRGGLNKYSFGKPNSDGSLEMPYKKIYGLEHLAIFILKKLKRSKKVYENEVVYLINAFQIAIILLGFILFL